MITVTTLTLKDFKSAPHDLAVFLYEDAGLAGAKSLTGAAKATLSAKLKEEGFKGGAKEFARVDLEYLGKHRRVYAVGLGKKKGAGSETFRRAAGALLGALRSKREKVALLCSEHPQALAEGLLLASYKFEEYKKADPDTLTQAALLAQDAGSRASVEKACAKAALYAEAVAFARDMVNRAPSDKTPTSLGDIAKSFKSSDLSVNIIDKTRAADMGMGSFLGVARGSSEPPIMAHLVYKPKDAKKKVALVGKGVTFDSGGLSLKPRNRWRT
ncbi:MAG: M17 family peptidase N-terminal domain-containing protein [Elusimicrobiota bacterium]